MERNTEKNMAEYTHERKKKETSIIDPFNNLQESIFRSFDDKKGK